MNEERENPVCEISFYFMESFLQVFSFFFPFFEVKCFLNLEKYEKIKG